MRKCDVSIEFAHLYADQRFSLEQHHSLEIASGKRKSLISNGISVATLVMIDDLHSIESITDARSLRQDVGRRGGQVDDVILESTLIPGSLELIESIPRSLVWSETFRRERKEVLFMETSAGKTPLVTIKNGRKVPSCAILSATLLLTRLGALRPVIGVTRAKRAVTIIEERFRYLEECALSIITMTRFADYGEKVETIHFEVSDECLLSAA